MKKRYERTVRELLALEKGKAQGLLTEDDLAPLPEPVRNYIRLTGAVGREKVTSFRAEFEGGIRSDEKAAFMPLQSVQYNFTEPSSRIFYIVARKAGIPARGIHIYRDCKAIMTIRLLGLITVADAKGWQMDQGETVTVFNDMCFMAPASLIDSRIEWEEEGSRSVRARFTNGSVSVSATLFFNESGELVNFISNDRFETKDGKVYRNFPWETPVTAYREINGYRLPAEAKLIYKYPGSDFCYGEFRLKDIEYNPDRYR